MEYSLKKTYFIRYIPSVFFLKFCKLFILIPSIDAIKNSQNYEYLPFALIRFQISSLNIFTLETQTNELYLPGTASCTSASPCLSRNIFCKYLFCIHRIEVTLELFERCNKFFKHGGYVMFGLFFLDVRRAVNHRG